MSTTRKIWISVAVALAIAAMVLAATVDESDQVAFNAALGGAGMLLGLLYGLLWSPSQVSKAQHWLAGIGVLGAVALLVAGILAEGLTLSRQTAWIAMGAALLSAIGGSAASRIP